MTNTFEHLRALLIKDYQLDPDLLTLDAELEALGIDSLGVAELLFNVEDEFNITLSPDAVQLFTLGDVVGFIDQLIAIDFKLRGPSLTFSTVCSSSAVAIGEAWLRVASGSLDLAIAGGCEAPLSFGSMESLGGAAYAGYH
jgi:acyl carrier protein